MQAPTPVIGESPAFIATLEHASQAAALDRPVLVIGERGTGKELIAQRLHFLSPRWDQPLLKLNCAALTESLLESELFGHEAGAFTGATQRRHGRFEAADGGTLFLDELATVPLRMQEKILRVIEYGEFERVGGSTTLKVDVRIVAATNEDLPALAEAGRFRADLLDRLAFDVITVPPLRARPEDVLVLAEHFAMEITRELGRPYFAGFDDDARRVLLGHPWRGNVRELKNVVERSVYHHDEIDEPLTELVLDPFESPWRPSYSDGERRTESSEAEGGSPEGGPYDLAEGARPAARRPQLAAIPSDLDAAVAEFERSAIEAALEETRWNQSRAAELLGLSYHQLRGRMRKYGIEAG